MNLNGLPYFEQYFGVWAVQPDVFHAAYNHVRALNFSLHMQSSAPAETQAAQSSQPQRASGGIALVTLHGTLMKHAASMTRSTSTVSARRQIRAAVRDEDIAGILLHIDSPGGTVAGTKDLADEIASAKAKKPVYAYCEDLCASAAYWLASQADKVFANPTALVGSIGTFLVVYDASQMAAMEGIKVHVIKAGDFKGAGTPGTEVTPEQLAEFQRNVSELNEHFVAGVMEGRKLTDKQVRGLADGRVHLAAAAKDLKLIDGIGSLDDTMRQLVSQTKKARIMSTTTALETQAATAPAAGPAPAPTLVPASAAPAAASLRELKAGCPGATDSFLLAQLEAGATLAAAQTAWMAEQSKQIAELNDKLAKASDADAGSTGKRKPGVQPLSTESENKSHATDAIAAWNEAVAERVKAGQPKAKAISALVKAEPDLYAAYLEAYNAERGRR